MCGRIPISKMKPASYLRAVCRRPAKLRRRQQGISCRPAKKSVIGNPDATMTVNQ
jgi:hypothetical protein